MNARTGLATLGLILAGNVGVLPGVADQHSKRSLPSVEGKYVFSATGEDIPLDAGIAEISKTSEGKYRIRLRFAHRTWTAPFELRKHESKSLKPMNIPPSFVFDTVISNKAGDVPETLILSGHYGDGLLSGRLLYHQGFGTPFRLGKFVLRPIDEAEKGGSEPAP